MASSSNGCSVGGGWVVERVVHVWCEDRGHEAVVAALVRTIGRTLGVELRIETMNGEGGAPRAITEFKIWQRAVKKGSLGGVPDILIIVIDANGHGHAARRSEVEQVVDAGLFPHVVIGCPDPHVEAWLLLDPTAFRSVTGALPVAHQPRPGEDHKGLFHASVAASGIPVLTGPMELAPDIVAAMDIDKAARSDRSLGAFQADLRAAIAQLRDRS
jgi:hypothetical protein